MKGIGKLSLEILTELHQLGGEADRRIINLTPYNTTRLINLGYLKQGNLTCTSGYRVALTTKTTQHLTQNK